MQARSNPLETNSALKYLWARNRITVLSDYNFLQSDSKRTEEVTQLGLKYNLLTAYTSFIAVDSEVRNRDGNSTTIHQPLPLPEGVSDYAVGNFKSAGFAPGVRYKAMSPAADASRGGLVRQESAREVAAEKKDKIFA